jgi:UDP-N-acetylmuramate dehydrogenase
MQILENYDLTHLNTFGVKARARFFVEIKNEEEMNDLFSLSLFQNNHKLFLGGGSNILFTKDFEGIVVLNSLKGIQILEENEDEVLVHAMGGESWQDLVLFSVDRNFWGIENLSLVPGTVGASPIQNIGAYGVELKDTLEKVYCFDIETQNIVVFSNAECNFGYRDSIFKNEAKGRYVITNVTYRLSKSFSKIPDYPGVKRYFIDNNINNPHLKEIREAIIFIRNEKLPNLKELPNAGSFFKNPIVPKGFADLLKEKYNINNEENIIEINCIDNIDNIKHKLKLDF